MEGATGAPSSSTVYDPRRLRASGRDGVGLMNRPPSPLTMLFSRHTRRREFIAGLGSAAAWPSAVLAQGARNPAVVGYLGPTTAAGSSEITSAFVQGLRELGWVEGRNIVIEYRWAQRRAEFITEFLAEFPRRRVDVIVTVGNQYALLAKRATLVIPIVFTVAADPIGTRLVESLARPGGNDLCAHCAAADCVCC
jgi:hypothetical protein